LCYASARLGEKIAFGSAGDLVDFDFRAQEAPEYFFLRRYLDQPELSRLHEYLHAPEMRNAIGKFALLAPR
jgi:hypothetical protein